MRPNILFTHPCKLLSFFTCCILFFTINLNAQQTVVINEINYRNINNQQNIKFVELHNYGFTPVDISNWFLTAGINYTFPAGTSINAGSYLVIAQDKATSESFFTSKHANRRLTYS